jgi:hypothetical protein
MTFQEKLSPVLKMSKIYTYTNLNEKAILVCDRLLEEICLG